MLTVRCGHLGARSAAVNRRVALQIGSLGAAMTAAPAGQAIASPAVARTGKCKAVILVWLDGGASHLETYDPKPGAPREYRGPLNAISTSVPGIQFGESFPRQAQMMDKMSVVRTVSHKSGDHFYCAHWALTGYESRSNGLDVPIRYPSAGAVISRACGSLRPGMPAYVAIPTASSFGHRPGYHGASYLGSPYNPLETVAEPQLAGFRVANMALEQGLNLPRLEDRRSLLTQLDRLKRGVLDSGQAAARDQFQEQALDLLASNRAAAAFDLEAEPSATRDRYGRHLYGQSCLLARRLVEAGVSFVTVHTGGLGGWDHHSQIELGMRYQAPSTDQAVAALVEDLDARGMLDEVMVWVMGDLGRTPRMNADGGRDHWDVMSVALAGGGCQPGRVVGTTNSRAEYATQDRTTPADVLATVYHLMGIDLRTHFLDHAGRPTPIVADGAVISGLL